MLRGLDNITWMKPVLDPSKHYEDGEGSRIELRQLESKPRADSISFSGKPTSDPNAAWRLYNGDGTCPLLDKHSLVKEWPSDDPSTYYPLAKRPDETYRPIMQAYGELSTLRKDWASQVRYGLHISRDENGPTAEIVTL